MLRIFQMIALALVFFGGACLSYFNADRVHFNYLFGETDLRLIVLLVGAFVLAVLLTLLLCAAKYLGLSAEIRRLRRKLRDAETELKNLRNLPPDVGV